MAINTLEEELLSRLTDKERIDYYSIKLEQIVKQVIQSDIDNSK
jgi:hypothetical protein